MFKHLDFFFAFRLDSYATRPVRAGGRMWNYKAKLNKSNGQIISRLENILHFQFIFKKINVLYQSEKCYCLISLEIQEKNNNFQLNKYISKG